MVFFLCLGSSSRVFFLCEPVFSLFFGSDDMEELFPGSIHRR